MNSKNKIVWSWTGEEGTIEEVKECVGPGWGSLIEKLCNDLFALGWSGRLVQVKEKFGGLRFYDDDVGLGNEMCKLIDEAEALSYKTCEQCGEPGVLRRVGWWKTLCDKCCGSP